MFIKDKEASHKQSFLFPTIEFKNLSIPNTKHTTIVIRNLVASIVTAAKETSSLFLQWLACARYRSSLDVLLYQDRRKQQFSAAVNIQRQQLLLFWHHRRRSVRW